MAIFNKVLNILIFILAGVSVTFGFFLFEKREELRKRGDYMARVINEVSASLDAGSGTEYQAKLDYKNRYQLDPLKEKYDKGKNEISLFHNNYAKLKTVLTPFKAQAVDVIAQRDQLSTTLHTVLMDLEIPIANEFEPNTFMAIETYGEQDAKLLEIVKKVTARDNAIMAQIADSVGVMGGSLDASTLKHLDDYTTPLGEFATVAQKLRTRSDTYASAIGDLCGIFEISAPSLSGEDYNSALDTVKTEMQGQKDEFEATKADLKQTKLDLVAAKETIEEKIKIIGERDTEIADLREKLDKFVDIDKPIDPKDLDLESKLTGKILRVNDKWGFVVIDLGLNNQMSVGRKKGEEKLTTVPLPEDKRMDVRRGSKYIGQILIVKVAENCAIGNIVPETITDKMEPGDEVNFPRQNKSINQDILEDDNE